MDAVYHFHGDLANLLRKRWRKPQPFLQPVTRSASIKDVIEAFGLPHTEIGRIACDGQTTDFSCRVLARQRYDLYPIPAPWDITVPTLLRPLPLPGLSFLVDGNIGRLARYLRMAGFDTLYDPTWEERRLVLELRKERRILLTRNLDLLKRKEVAFGRYVRAMTPVKQLQEILDLCGCNDLSRSLGRCLECNALLQPIPKKDILHRLEPLTLQYYNSFSICPGCNRIYWPGSHVDKMQQSLRRARP